MLRARGEIKGLPASLTARPTSSSNLLAAGGDFDWPCARAVCGRRGGDPTLDLEGTRRESSSPRPPRVRVGIDVNECGGSASISYPARVRAARAEG